MQLCLSIILSIFLTQSAQAQISYDADTLKNRSILLGERNTPMITDLFSSQDSNCSFFKILPLAWHVRYNGNRPFAENDGSFAAYGGFQSITQLGIEARIKPIEIRFSPQLHNILPQAYDVSKTWGSQNLGKRHELSLQGSFLKFHIWKFSLRAAEGNLLLGSTNLDHLMLGNNAPGFRHLGLSTSKPVGIGIGSLEFDLIAGTLSSLNPYLPQEIANLKSHPASFAKIGDRRFSGLTLVYHPSFLKNSSFGLIRQFQYTKIARQRLNGLVDKHFPVFEGFFKKNIGGSVEDNKERDQQVSLNYNLHIPSIHTVFSIEYGWNDHEWNLRDLLLSWPHSSAYIISAKKIFLNKNGYTDWVVEYAHLKQQLEYSVRNAFDWYQYGQSQLGFTQHGQVLGIGGSNGLGLNKFTIQYRNIQGPRHWMLRYQLIANDHAYLKWPIWKDHVFSAANSRNFGRLTMRNEVKAIQSSGYAFVLGKHKTSFQTNSSIYYRLQ